jgi:ComF family protein
MGEWMARVRFPDDAVDARICVPVPTTRTRYRQRGYNQAELLARSFAQATRRRVVCALIRTGAASSQTALQPAARGANVAGAFRVSDNASRSLQETHLLLVDDVLTTGATATECVRTLTAAGARCISVVTFARALDVRRLTQT